MKIRFKDLNNNRNKTILNVQDVVIITGDQNETILIEDRNGNFYSAITVFFEE